MSTSSPFSPKLLTAIIASMITLFGASLLLSGSGGDSTTGEPYAAHSYSSSAVGHLGIYKILQDSGKDVSRGEGDIIAKLGRHGVLIEAEPEQALTSDENRIKLQDAKTVLLILPKWMAAPDENNQNWVSSVRMVPDFVPQGLLAAFDTDGRIVTTENSAFNNNDLGVRPKLTNKAQLIVNSKMKPLVSNPDGILLGEITNKDRRILVLSDPDPFQNHGLSEADNAAFDLALLDRFGDSGPVIFDETVHGFRTSSAPSLAKFVIEFPFNMVALQVLVAIGLLLLATTKRFGVPLSTQSVLENGKQNLIDSAALLMDFGGHHDATLKRYIKATIRHTAVLLHAPRGQSDAQMIQWLGRTAKGRGAQDDISKILETSQSAGQKDISTQFTAARATHKWKREIINGR